MDLRYKHQQIHTLTFPPKMSNLAPSCTLAVDKENSSEETGCKSGLVATCKQISVNSFAVRSLISLCRIEDNPPLEQDRACSTEKDVPQAQYVGVQRGSQP